MKTRLFTLTALLLATAACTQDELADGDRLPEGQYPLEIARITLGVEGGEAQPWGAPQTRVSENGDGTGSVFDAGDRFAVQIDGEDETGIYTVQDDGTATSDAPLYWTNTTPNRTVTAWYPATDGTLDLGDQSQSLAYLLGGTGTGDYQTDVTLSFTHQLAKVRVTPSDDALDQVQSLQLYTYTQCTYEKGKAGQGSQEGWIEMKKCEYTENGATITCWEANVVPGYTITKLQANGTEERNLSAAITPEAGKFYNITLNKDKGYTDDGQGNYTVTSAEGLKNIAELVNGGKTDINITLDKNIDLTGKEWTPIGTSSSSYTGTFDGGGHTITGLTINQSATSNVGLFASIAEGGTVKNLTLKDVNITADSNAGAIAGENRGTIENCSVSGSVTSSSNNSFVGGITGWNYRGTITDCHSSATVEGKAYVGGIAGQSDATITACYSTGSVTATKNNTTGYSFAGGVVGYNNGAVLIACYATDSVSGGGDFVGGVVGSNENGTLTACYHATGKVSGASGSTGGVVGRNLQNIGFTTIVTACYWGDNGQEQGIGYNQAGTGETTMVTDGDWQNAVTQMNAALQSAGSEWQYELTGALPTLKKQ